MEIYPLLPVNYFDETTESALRSIEVKARASRDEKTLGELLTVLGGVRIQNGWRCTGALIYRNWLKHLCMQKRCSAKLMVGAGA
jgi:hypothetical protein